jgi:hypothetical protein
MDSDSDLDSDLDLDSKTHSPYRMTYIAGQGTQSAVGMKPIDLAVSSHIYKAIGQAVSRIVCDRTKKKMPFMGLEPHTFCYPGRCPSQLD